MSTNDDEISKRPIRATSLEIINEILDALDCCTSYEKMSTTWLPRLLPVDKNQNV